MPESRSSPKSLVGGIDRPVLRRLGIVLRDDRHVRPGAAAPSQVFVTLFQKFPLLWPHILQTLATTMIGFVLGVGLGVVLGAVIGVSKTAYDTAYPLLVGFSSIPKVAVVPIFVLWFGSGSVPAVLTALSICFFPIVVNIATGLATTEPELEDVLKALGASKFDILWNVGLPRTMPFFFASLKVAVSYAFVGAVLSETVASNRGIGNVMMTASSNFNVPLVSPACSCSPVSASRSTSSSR